MKTCSETKIALVALFCGALCLAGQGAAIEPDAATEVAVSEAIVIDNAPTHAAAQVENLTLPEAWNESGSWTITVKGTSPDATVEGAAKSVTGSSYAWSTGPYSPDETYEVTLSNGTTSYTANFTIDGLAYANWGTLTIDNNSQHIAKSSESLALPAAWGEADVKDLKLTITDDMGTRTIDLSSDATTYDWNTQPYMPGDFYQAQLTWTDANGQTVTSYDTARFTVEGKDMTAAEETVALDNAFEDDPSGQKVRVIDNHTNLFQLVALGSTAQSQTLTLNGAAVAATPDENGQWLWNTNNCYYGLYTFTNTVDGVEQVATFRVNGEIGVIFPDKVLPVAQSFYTANVGEITGMETLEEMSNALKQNAANGTPLWQNYVMGWDPATNYPGLIVEVKSVDPDNGKMNVKIQGRLTDKAKYGTLIPKFKLYQSTTKKNGFTQLGDAQTSPEFNDVLFTSDGQHYFRGVFVLESEE